MMQRKASGHLELKLDLEKCLGVASTKDGKKEEEGPGKDTQGVEREKVMAAGGNQTKKKQRKYRGEDQEPGFD